MELLPTPANSTKGACFLLTRRKLQRQSLCEHALDAGAKFVVYDDMEFKPASENALLLKTA